MQYMYDENGIISVAEFPVVAGFGVQIPANGFELDNELVKRKGYAWFFNDGEPVELIDERGFYYSTKTGLQVEFKKLGALPDDLTAIKPLGLYDVWDGVKWVADKEKETQDLKTKAVAEQDRLLSIASEKIAPLQDAVDLNMATDEEEQQLKAWKKYRVLLSRIENLGTLSDAIEWPKQPA